MDSSVKVREQKQAMRLEIREALNALSSDCISGASRKIQDDVIALPEFDGADVVCCYVAVQHEVRTRRIIEACWQRGKTVCVPAARQGTCSYEPARWEAGSPTVAGRFGIPEPATKSWVPMGSVALMIVPGLAFDRFGGRLGRGGGHYDAMMRAVTGRRPFSAGLAFELQVLAHVPVNDHDVKLDAVITETKTIRTEERH
jgi:5-formyltetrahydrofolate cyclo-ligase